MPRSDTVIELAGAIHVCHMRTDAIDERACREWYELLSDEERARHARLLNRQGQRMFLVAHAFLRTTLSRYAAVSPFEWQFRTSRYGKPEIAVPTTSLRFSLSHTTSLVACAIAERDAVGVDVEWVRPGPAARIPQRYFSRQEVDDLAEVPPTQRRNAFFDYWTLKEAFLKGCGTGLTAGVHRCSFRVSHDMPPALTCTPAGGDDAAAWQFALNQPGPEHRLAVAVRRAAAIQTRFEFIAIGE